MLLGLVISIFYPNLLLQVVDYAVLSDIFISRIKYISKNEDKNKKGSIQLKMKYSEDPCASSNVPPINITGVNHVTHELGGHTPEYIPLDVV